MGTIFVERNKKNGLLTLMKVIMSTTTPTAIIDEVKNLISYSITNPEVENAKFEDLHRSIIKRYFDARNIKIDYMAQTIDLKLPMSNSKYTNITFECLDLSSFLQSCIRSDEGSLSFYQNLLAHYDIMCAA
jgi:sensor domain CHASE-containing protein